MRFSEGITQVISEGIALSALFDLLNIFSEGVWKKVGIMGEGSLVIIQSLAGKFDFEHRSLFYQSVMFHLLSFLSISSHRLTSFTNLR